MAKPKLRFPEFTDEWNEKTLDKLFEYKNGDSLENSLDENGNYYLISLNSIDKNGNLQNKLKRVINAKWFLKKNDIVMVLSDIGKGNFLGLSEIIPEDNKYVLNQRMGLLRAKAEINITYARTYINFSQKYFKSCGQGSAQLNISKGDVLKFVLKIPCIKEQQKIADFLSKVDKKIANQEAVISDYEEMKKGLMQKIFSQEVRFKADDGSEYPEWEEKRLGDAVETVTDYVAAGSFADLAKNVIYNNFKDYAQLIRTTDLKSDFLRNDFVYVSESAFRYLYRVNLDKESIIMPNVGNCGEIYYIIPKKLPYKNNVLGPNAILLRSSSVNNKFLSYLFVQKDFQVKLKIITSPSGQTKFNKTDLKNIRFYIPCADEQQKIADCLSAMDRKIEAEKKILEDWKELKKALLQQMFV